MFSTLPFDCSSVPRYEFLFSPQSSAALKRKDGCYNFHNQKIEHSPAKITLVLQTTPVGPYLKTYAKQQVKSSEVNKILNSHGYSQLR